MSVSPPAARRVSRDAEIYNAVLSRREDLTESLALFWVKAADRPAEFTPGQYMMLGLVVDDKLLQRSYSMASIPAATLSPAAADDYEFFVRRVEGGRFTSLLWDLPIGHPVRLFGPRGKLVLGPEADHAHVFISSGTGTAPFVSMMRTLLDAGHARQTIFMNGVSHVRELGYRTLLESWESSGTYPVVYAPTVSRSEEAENRDWLGRTGRVEAQVIDVLREQRIDARNAVVYLCGDPNMISGAREVLRDFGFQQDQIRSEDYWV